MEVNWKKCLKFLSLLIAISGCKTTPAETWKPDFYIADPEHGGIMRQEKKVSCASTELREYVCLSKAHLEILHQKCFQD